MAEKIIKTLVLLVMENRSFDHMFGWMNTINPDIDGVTGQESNPLNTSDPDSERVMFGDGSVYVDPDPGHAYQDIYEQVYGEPWSQESVAKNPPPTMQGFVQNANRKKPGLDATVMNGFKPDLLPVYKELVTEFAICDRWFSSLPSLTQPNRLFVHSATSHGLIANDMKKLNEGLPQKTIFDSLHESGQNFGIYYQTAPSTLYYRSLRKLKYATKFHPFDISFKRHCKEGKLPNYVVIEPRYFDLPLPGNDDHPSHDISNGQKLVKEIYEALRSSPQWNETLFVIVYDEHGGFYDHVPPPIEGVPNPDDIVSPEPYSFNFDQLGVRVPAIFVSPWIKSGTVLHEPSGPQPTSQYEHSSIPATIKKLFNLNEFLNKRDAWAGTFEVVLNLTTPRTDCPVTLPEPTKLRESEAKEDQKLSHFQEELVQLVASIKGDHNKIKDKCWEEMNVAQASEYSNKGFEDFLKECTKAKLNGVHEDFVATIESLHNHESNREDLTPKSFLRKLCSCSGW